MYNPTNFAELFDKYVNDECTPEEKIQFINMLVADECPAELKGKIKEFLNSDPLESHIAKGEVRKLVKTNMKRILKTIEDAELPLVKPLKFSWWRLSVASVLVMLAGAIVFFSVFKKANNQSALVTKNKHDLVDEIKPGSNNAILSLADGKQVVLNEAKNGTIAEQGNYKVIKIDGKLAYQKDNGEDLFAYNTVTTPKGGQYQLVLADGSSVWLNAASSLRFPTSFSGKERTVELTGEGYFEIAKNAAQPFHVKVNNMDVEVIGTHFNIMAYRDEVATKTTLLEGSVKLKSATNTVSLKPGQQAKIEKATINVVSNVDVEEVIAWKNGFFQFERNANLEEVMRQIARWYDVEINYEGVIPKRRFGGKISRESNLTEVLKVFELNKINVIVDGRKLNVMP